MRTLYVIMMKVKGTFYTYDLHLNVTLMYAVKVIFNSSGSSCRVREGARNMKSALVAILL